MDWGFSDGVLFAPLYIRNKLERMKKVNKKTIHIFKEQLLEITAKGVKKNFSIQRLESSSIAKMKSMTVLKNFIFSYITPAKRK